MVARLYEDAHLEGAACIHALCDAECDAIRGYGLRNPVAVIPNGVDLPDLSALVAEPEWSRLLPTGAKVLLFLSRIHPKKGLVQLIDAWASARRRRVSGIDKWYLVIAGWEQGGHQVELEQRVRALHLEGLVLFVGPQFGAEKAASFRRADAFVLPSYSEGLPMAVLEAWSYGLPVAMTPECNLPEGFAAGAAIRLVPEGDGMVDGLATLFGINEAERHALGQRGRRLVEQKFVWKRIGAEMTEVYRWVLGQAEKPETVRVA
jgi:poly(glycerol-phosphate) alpha-glucosyltransferase